MTVYAVQWTGRNETELTAFASTRFETVDEEDRGDDPEATAALLESVHDSWVPLAPGDWVIQGGTGLFFRCAEADFDDRYEPVTDA